MAAIFSTPVSFLITQWQHAFSDLIDEQGESLFLVPPRGIRSCMSLLIVLLPLSKSLIPLNIRTCDLI